MDQKKILSLIMLFCGLIFLWMGYKDYQFLSSEYNPLFTISPGNETMLLIIIGIAASIGGFIGVVRDKIV